MPLYVPALVLQSSLFRDNITVYLQLTALMIMTRLIHKKVGWRLTSAGWLTVIVVLVLGDVVVVTRLHGFLSVQKPVVARAMVISGTLPDTVLEQIVAEMKKDSNLLVLTVGGPIKRGGHLSSHHDYANLAAATLIQIGGPASEIVAVPSPSTRRDRVFASALALRNWLNDSDIRIDSVNVYALGVRGRRTLILFEKALGPDITVGVISIPDPSYDPSRWWATSEGFRTVIGELIAYVYLKTLFKFNH